MLILVAAYLLLRSKPGASSAVAPDAVGSFIDWGTQLAQSIRPAVGEGLPMRDNNAASGSYGSPQTQPGPLSVGAQPDAASSRLLAQGLKPSTAATSADVWRGTPPLGGVSPRPPVATGPTSEARTGRGAF